MMINQLNALLARLSMPQYRPSAPRGYLDADNHYHVHTTTPVHDVLDHIDRHVGIITRFKLDGSLAPVGERVRRLERRLYLQETPPYFWLGAEAETLALTG